MATKRLSDGSSLANSFKLSRGATSAAIPLTPTIGTATKTGISSATVAYTAATLGAAASSFTATSNPENITASGSSPITVTGLTPGTNYTFTVKANNSNGSSPESSASNQITTDSQLSVNYLVVAGGGGGGPYGTGSRGGGGGAGGLRCTATAAGGGGTLAAALLSSSSTN